MTDLINKKIELSQEQINIINLDKGCHLVLAPPGCGKTELLSRRVNSALEKGVKPQDIICLTFTNRAARNMKERISRPDLVKDLFIGNIHAYAHYFLKSNKLIPSITSVLDEEDSENIMTQAMEELDSPAKLSDLLIYNNYLNQIKLMLPNLPSGKNRQKGPGFDEICERYEQLKKESYSVDYDDLLNLTYYFLNSSSGNYKHEKHKWIQVDEVQDINTIQFKIINLVKNSDSHCVYFGDHEQAIFSFIGADAIELLNETSKFEKHYLSINYRSPSYLLNVYNTFIKTHINPGWVKPPVSNNQTQPNNLNLRTYHIPGDQKVEAQYIANSIIKSYAAEGKQIAILTRTNIASEMYSDCIKQDSLVCFKVSGFDLFRRKITKDVLSFLKILNEPNSRIAWQRLFHIFGKTNTLSETRDFVNNLFDLGFRPLDFLNIQSRMYENLDIAIDYFINTRVVIFDTETTGLNTDEDDIIQLSAVEYIRGIQNREFNIYLKSDKDLTESSKIHGVTNEYINNNGIDRKTAITDFLEFIGDSPLFGHNVRFDMKMLISNLKRSGLYSPEIAKIKYYDTLDLSYRLFPNFSSYKLEDICNYLKFPSFESHNALEDVKATALLLIALKDKLEIINSERKKFIEEYEDLLSKFSINLTPVYSDLGKYKVSIIHFHELIKYLVNNLQILRYYDVKESDHFKKFMRHVTLKCEPDTFKNLIRNYVPQYSHFKETDLLIGNENIVLSTVHKAKGLEFETVIIPQCNQDIYPFYYSVQEGNIKEDIRLFYVAMTRARVNLILTTHSDSVNKYGTIFKKKASPFLLSIEKYFKTISVQI